MPEAPEVNDRLRQAMQLLCDEARERLDRHPLGHLVAGRGDRLDIRLPVPTALRDGWLDQLSQGAAGAIQEAIQSLLQHNSVFLPGRIFCLRCQSARCEHAAPTDPRQVFAGYGKTGVPRFVDFGQWLLQRHDPRVDLLYRDPPALLTTVDSGEELEKDLLSVFRQHESGYRLHGQVAAGWFPVAGEAGRYPLAVSFQVISSRPPKQRRRFGLNVIGIGREGQALEHVFDRTRTPPWADGVRWAQSVLVGIEHQLERSPRTPPGAVQGRIDGLLNALARRLDKSFRGQERRTRHGQQRHSEGDRPTRMALADFARAAPEDLLYDTRRETLVVLGDRGRTHVFNRDGKLVTSVRYNPTAIERRRQNGSWRPAAAQEVQDLRQRLAERPDLPEAEAQGAS